MLWLAKQDYRGDNPLDRAIMEARRLLAEEQAQKPTAPAGLVEELTRELFNELRFANIPYDNYAAMRDIFKEVEKKYISRYRPAPSSDEGNAWMSTAAQYARNSDYYRGLVIRIGKAIGESAYTADDGSRSQDVLCAKVPELVEAILRHPATAKSADRCGELVERLRAHIKYQKESEADYLVYGEIEDILSEFSKDADGKETTK